MQVKLKKKQNNQKAKVKLTYQELANKKNCNNENARRICIKLFTEGKIERNKIKGEYGRPYYRYYYD